MLFKPSMSAEVQDWITPPQVEVVRVATHVEQLARIQQRANELREEMGPRYLCHEKNRVRRLDGRSYRPRTAVNTNVRAMKRAA
ncbi:MAG: hypothetical protein M3N35_00435 [Candidatus Binatota bacterium]|nr:hypothetical protein [Candidatus Binatota bacterium]